MKWRIFPLLEALCAIDGISGSEESVRNRILEEVRPYADTCTCTPLGQFDCF